MSSAHPIVVTFNEVDQTLVAKWTIKNYLNITANKIKSQIFSHKSSEVKWRLVLDRNHVQDNSKCLLVTISTLSLVNVRVVFDMHFETEFGEADIQKHLKPDLIGRGGFYIPDGLVKLEELGNYLKPDGSLVFVVWMNYATLTCDRDWFNTRLVMSDGFKQVLDGKYTDIIFKVDNFTIKAHKVIVASCKYFETLIDNVDLNTNTIEISDLKFAVFRGLLEYIYAGSLVLTNVNFTIDLRVAAEKYDLQGLVQICEDYIAKKVAPSDVTKAILSTTVLESVKIKEACAKLIRSHPQDIVDCGDIFDNEELRVYLLQHN